MFTAVVHKNQNAAEGYFDEHLAQNDYYAVGELRPGQWIGLGAERLGLDGNVTREQFHALCGNRHPLTGHQLTPRQEAKDKRRVFYDFTCSPPKSVSVLAMVLDDTRLVEAHTESARVAFHELETFAAARVRKAGSQQDRTTGSLLAAAFVHTSSRALDPLLHTHFTVFNATFDEREGGWKALQAGAMYDAIRYGTAVYRNELARRMQEIGYQIAPAKHGFEIEGVSDAILKRFSKRSQQRDDAVREMEQKLGRKLSNDEVSYAVHQTRPRKLKGVSTAEVRDRQRAQLKPAELQSLRQLCSSIRRPQIVRRSDTEQRSLAFATSHIFERKSVAPEHELLEAALKHGYGEIELSRLKTVLRQSPELLPTDKGYSTREILRTELSLIAAVTNGKSAVGPLNYTYRPADWLSADQQTAIRHVLQCTDRVTGIRGLAGTGKTTALKELNTACAQSGYLLRFCAPTTAATEVLRKEGFAAVTLEALLRESGRNLSAQSVIVLDEAGAVAVDDMERLLRLGVRVILSGDTGQHSSVKRGDALRIIEEHSPYIFGRLTQIRRQRRADYRRVVELAARKQTAAAFAELGRMGDITELERDKLHATAASAYVSATMERKSALLVAPTWAEIEAVTEKVRAALKEAGRLTGKEQGFCVFDSLSWTEAQKRDVHQYRPGQVLRFHRARGGFARDESVAIVEVMDRALNVRRKDGSGASLELEAGTACFDVGASKTLHVTPGDKLLLQANRAKQFVNGELVEVKSIHGGFITLTDGRVLPSNYITFTHGYAVTSHAAQGKTVDAVFVVASTRSLPAVHREQFYVSISRGRDQCRVFTDDKDLLHAHVTDSSARLAAIEAIATTPRRSLLAFARQIAQRVAATAGRSHQALSPAQFIEPSAPELPRARQGRNQTI